jgi:hypothetical protein
MGLKFRRRQKLFPGVYLNFSAKGVSTTIGIKGLSLNLGKQGAYLNTGIPGTGFYDRKKISSWSNKTTSSTENFALPDVSDIPQDPYYFLPKKLEGEIKSNDANSVTSQGLAEMKETLLAAYKEKIDIQQEIPQVQAKVKNAASIKLLSQIFLVGLFTKKFKEQHAEKENYLNDLKQQLLECKVTIDIDIQENLKSKYDNLKSSFGNLSTCSKIWDKTSSVGNNDNRSAANQSINRTQSLIATQKIDFINASFDGLHFKNQNGSDIYIYPAFAVLFDDKNNFGLVDLADLELSFKRTSFLEEEQIPLDTKVIGETWAKVNKNGTPDKRFKDNYKIPIVEYGEIEFKSNTGINEVFMFSNPTKANNFVETFKSYVAPSYVPYFIEEKIADDVTSKDIKTYTSSKQTGVMGNETDFYAKRTLILSPNSYKIELPDNTVISGSMSRQPNSEEGKTVYLTDTGCPIAIGSKEILVNLYRTHEAAYVFHLD